MSLPYTHSKQIVCLYLPDKSQITKKICIIHLVRKRAICFLNKEMKSASGAFKIHEHVDEHVGCPFLTFNM